MTNETKLHRALDSLKLPPVPWAAKEAFSEEYYICSTHTNIRDKEDDRSIAIAVDDEVVPLFLASPEMLSWMVQDLTTIGMTDEEMSKHKHIGRDIIRRASNGKINLNQTK